MERLDGLLAEARQLSEACHIPGRDCFAAFRDLTKRILALTVAHGTSASLVGSPQRSGRALVVSGTRTDPYAPLRLRSGGSLVIFISLDNHGDEGYLRVIESKFQYATGEGKDDWVFRYDFLRSPKNRYPAAHLQINGDVLPGVPNRPERHLPDIHFPVGRPTLEGVIRLLIDQLGVTSNEPASVWRPVLAVTERSFLDNAHQPLSGPDDYDESEDSN